MKFSEEKSILRKKRKPSKRKEEQSEKNKQKGKKRRPWRQAVRHQAKQRRKTEEQEEGKAGEEDRGNEEEKLSSEVGANVVKKRRKLSKEKRAKRRREFDGEGKSDGTGGDTAADESDGHSLLLPSVDASRFRFLNERLCSQTSVASAKLFEDDPDSFRLYHRGYRHQLKCHQMDQHRAVYSLRAKEIRTNMSQAFGGALNCLSMGPRNRVHKITVVVNAQMVVSKWPVNPLEKIVLNLSSLPRGSVIADLGCGEAEIAKRLGDRFHVHSFDFVAPNERVQAADMAHLPLGADSVDVCVFCLSLMGTNLAQFFREAHRVLKIHGKVKIVEIASRFRSVASFVSALSKMGFQLKQKKSIADEFFVLLTLEKVAEKIANKRPKNLQLLPFLYKKR